VAPAAAAAWPTAVAEIENDLLPSATALSTMLTGKMMDALPAGIVTKAGTVAVWMLLLVSVTTRGFVVGVLRKTVPLIVLTPTVSLKVLWLRLKLNVATSLSVTVRLMEAPFQPVDPTDIETPLLPSAMAFSTAEIANVTEV
jgi:hypothetical protein